MAEVETLVDQLVALSVTELIEFKKILKDKYGLEESVAVVATVAAPEKPVIEEKTSFNVVLTKVSEVSTEKLNAVKEINKLTAIGLKEAMNIAKNLPHTLKENASKVEAEEIRATFAALNAEITLT